MIGKKSFEIGPNDWLQGATSGANTGNGGFSNETDGVNITSFPGVLYAPPAGTDKSTNLTGEIIASCEDPTYLGEDRMFLDSEANFYLWTGSTLTKKDTSTSGFTQLTTDLVAWYDTSGGTNFYATTSAGANGDIVKWDGNVTLDESWWDSTLSQPTLSAFTPWRPMIVYETNLYCADKNNLHRIAPDLVVSNSILSLAYTDTISALGIDQATGQMLIATQTGSNYSGNRNGQSKIWVYDGYSNKARRVTNVNGTVTAFKSVGNTTYVFYGNKLGYWTGSGIEYLRTLNFAKGTSNYLINPHRVTSIDNTLYWVDTLPGSGGNNRQIMAFGETVDGIRSFYPVAYPGHSATSSLSCLTAISATKLGYAFTTDKFYTIDLTDTATSAGFNLYSKRYTFPTDVTFNGMLVELDQAAPSGSDTSLSINILDDKGNTTTTSYMVTGGRSDIYTWQFDYPSMTTRSIQLKLGRDADSLTLGVRRVTVFYTPKE